MQCGGCVGRVGVGLEKCSLCVCNFCLSVPVACPATQKVAVYVQRLEWRDWLVGYLTSGVVVVVFTGMVPLVEWQYGCTLLVGRWSEAFSRSRQGRWFRSTRTLCGMAARVGSALCTNVASPLSHPHVLVEG